MKKELKKAARNNVPDLRDDIKATTTYQSFLAERRQQRAFNFPFKKLSYGLSAAVILFALFMVLPLQNNNVSALYFEVNPSFQLSMDDNDMITAFTALNDDGEALKENTGDLEGKPFEEAIDIIIDEALELGMINADEQMLLYDVVSENAELQQRHLDLLEDKLNRVKNERALGFEMARGIGGMPTETELDIVRDYDIGIMQARIIGNILSETDEYTFEELLEYSMRDLMQLSDSFPPRQNHGPRRHPFDDNGTPPINPPGGRQ